MRTGVIAQDWATGIRKDITTAFKGTAEIIAGIAEPVMRYATIYLALATALAVLKVDVLYNAAMIIVIASPEFVIIGALSIAESAVKEGRKAWGFALFAVCFCLTIIMIATFTEVFQIIHFEEFHTRILNFSRCLVAVGFSIVLNKLDSGETQLPAIPLPDLDQLLADQRAQILAEMQEVLTAFRAEMVTQIESKIVAPEPIDYSQIVSKIQPVFSQFQASLQEEISAQIPTVEPVDYDAVASALLPVIEAKFAGLETVLNAQIPAPLDIAQLALELAPLVGVMSVVDDHENDHGDDPIDIESRRVTRALNDQIDDQECDHSDERFSDHQNAQRDTAPLAPTRITKTRTTGNNETLKKVRRLVKRNEQITPAEIAEKVDISPGHARKLKAQVLAERVS